MSFIITLQDYDDGEEYNIEVPEEDYRKITSGDYTLANKYFQYEKDKKDRLLAYRLALQKPIALLDKCNEKSNSGKTVAGESMPSTSSCVDLDSSNDEIMLCDPDVDQNDGTLTQRWNERETKQLIELFRENFEKLNDRKYKAKLVYVEMAEHFRFTPDQVESKIKNLRKTYKVILDNSTKTGRGRIQWPFFNLMHAILGNKPDNKPLSIASNRAGFKNFSNCDESESETTSKMPKITPEETVGSTPLGPNNNRIPKRKSCTTETSEPEWMKQFRSEMAQHHKERMDKQQQFLDLFKEFISKPKE